MFRPASAVVLLVLFGTSAQAQSTSKKPSPTTTRTTGRDTSGTSPPTTSATGSIPTSATQTRPTLTADEEAAAVAAAGGMGVLGVVCIVGACLLGLLVYLIPSVVAFSRGHPNAVAICAVNILLGWFFIGWVVALIWSFTAIDRDRRYR